MNAEYRVRQIIAELDRVSSLPEPDQHEYPDTAMYSRVTGKDPRLIGETCFTSFFMGLSKGQLRTLTYRLTGVYLKLRLFGADEYIDAIASARDKAIYHMQMTEQGEI